MITLVKSETENSESKVILSHTLYPINWFFGGNLSTNIRISETNYELEGKILPSDYVYSSSPRMPTV